MERSVSRHLARGSVARRTQESRLEELSDSELLARHLAAAGGKGRSAWLQELFRRYYPQVVGWCLRFAGDREEACDLAQGIFAKAYVHIGSFRGDSRISTWLYAITRSECMNHLKARRRRPASVEADALDELPNDAGSSPDEELQREGSARRLHAILDQTLDDTEKKVFTMHYGDGLPLDAITRLLELSNRSGAKAYIVSARRKLARAVALRKARDPALDV
ncbi:MAG TPA: RNA polymerase sigma factor [Anaeromyxobacteraceae bacterium]|nr:RNA polymerase sigma factor [Anaeromyxobacteraceae bacterium]